jgi:hypothetical protein
LHQIDKLQVAHSKGSIPFPLTTVYSHLRQCSPLQPHLLSSLQSRVLSKSDDTIAPVTDKTQSVCKRDCTRLLTGAWSLASEEVLDTPLQFALHNIGDAWALYIARRGGCIPPSALPEPDTLGRRNAPGRQSRAAPRQPEHINCPNTSNKATVRRLGHFWGFHGQQGDRASHEMTPRRAQSMGRKTRRF